MISRIYLRCLTCSGAITARVQVGHEKVQPVTFACPHCASELRLRLLLHDPPNVGLAYDDGCSEGDEEGLIVNVGAGFVIAKDRRHEDMYFPSFDLVPLLKRVADLEERVPRMGAGPVYVDTQIVLGNVRYLVDAWGLIKKMLRLHRIGRAELRDAQIREFWAQARDADPTPMGTLFAFFASFQAPREGAVLHPLIKLIDEAYERNPAELRRLASDFAGRWVNERVDAYADLLRDYFRGYGDFSQTLVYVKSNEPLTADRLASSSDFDSTRMFYGNAFEVLGAHLDLPASIFNILEGRAYDQFSSMTLKQYRTINKAGRGKCFAANAVLSSLVVEYDSTIRNASHHGWFKLGNCRENISYRSGGTGALQNMTYAEYLYRCNKLLLQIMALACVDLLFLSGSGSTL